jgi:D-lactate dehydrogenase
MDELPPAAAASLRELLPTERLCTDELTRTAFAPDASLYLLVPKAVVFPRTIAEIQQLFDWSRHYRIPLTFRAAGTSLSGQAVTDGVLVEVRRYWQRWELLENGRAVRAQPGVRAGLLNAFLRAYERRLGPDPASVEICTIGGIVANNSSGMCCGTRQTAYQTLRGLTCVLPNGLCSIPPRPMPMRSSWRKRRSWLRACSDCAPVSWRAPHFGSASNGSTGSKTPSATA